ncbi:S1 family peptidase [Rhodococcus sp. HNM0569]|uniref:S1 family peptidase n=1 Tax=Rhodococcus sp. HNM0569 TaxID=2716340 RepID=UPI00146DB313|nr:S1 family peptidase [Rhodococcus sp. HNM0569]NLU83292.1 S1 family peptidase [Rhodococcus sp. HNM0569]
MRFTARRVAVTGAAALLALSPLAGTASAEPAAPSDQGAALPAELVDALARDLQLSPDQYLERSDLAQRLAQFASDARAQYPEVFAGSWLDEQGNAVVAVAPGDDHDAAARAATDAGYTVTEAAQSERALTDKASELDTWLAEQPAAIADAVRGVTVDIRGNGLVLRTDDVAGFELPDFLDGARVVFAPAPAPLQPSNLEGVSDVLAPDALLGGDAFGAKGGGTGLRCSLGFNGTDASGRPINLTAGHCDPNLPAAGTGDSSEAFALSPNGTGPRLGTFAKSNLDGHDYAIIRADDASRHRFENNGVRVPGAAPLAITGTAQPVVGAPVCKSGTTSGFNCGIVQTVGQTVEVGNRVLTDGFSTNLCALQGDSGGPIVTGTRALGISSASNVGQYPLCQIADIVGFVLGQGPELFATPVETILGDNPGVNVRTN